MQLSPLDPVENTGKRWQDSHNISLFRRILIKGFCRMQAKEIVVTLDSKLDCFLFLFFKIFIKDSR